MSAVRFLQRCLDAGVDLETAMTVAAAFEEEVRVMFPGPKTGAARQRTYREKKTVTKVTEVTKSDEVRHQRNEVTAESVSPKPPSDNTPFSPPKGGQFPPLLAELSEEIWAMQPVLDGKRRATRPDTRRALDAAAKRGSLADIRTACLAFYALPESRKEGGRFAMGAAKLLSADRWRDFLPRPEPPAKPATPEVLAYRRQHFRDTGEWRAEWGNREQAA